MLGTIREVCGAALVLTALGVLFHGIAQLQARDYLACIILVLTGLSVMRAGMELLRPTIGE